MDNKITIIEGPTPTFEAVNDEWVLGLSDSPNLAGIAMTRLRTFNGNSLVERCYKAWDERTSIFLEFRNPEGLTNKAPILAARNIEVEEGDMLLLWVRLSENDFEIEIGYDDDDMNSDDDDEWGLSEL